MQLAFSNKVKISDASPRTAPVSTTHRVPLPPLPPPPCPPATPREWGEGLAKGRRGAFLPPSGGTLLSFPSKHGAKRSGKTEAEGHF